MVPMRNSVPQLVRRVMFAFKPGLLFGIALSICVGLMAYYVTLRTIDKENGERFWNMARTAQATIDARIKSYTNVVRAAESLFRAEPDITREQFHRFVTGLNLATHYPAIETLNYVSWVPDHGRDAFEAEMRRQHSLANDGRPPFRITPPGRRHEYAVVVFVEPEKYWLDSLGIDLWAQPLMYKAIGAARDNGRLSASGAPVQIMKEKKRLGLAMRLPVYRPGLPLNNVEQRRAAYLGSVGIAFSVERLVHGVLEELPLKTVRLSLYNHVETLNPSIPQPSQLIYDSSATEAMSAPPQRVDDGARFYVWLPVDFNGRRWNALFSTPKEAVYRGSDRSFPLLALLAGFTTTMLLYGLFYTLSSSRTRAVELAKGMTKELRESEAELMQSHQKLRQLTAHTEQIKESERKRIAREIHDDLGQNLLALRIDAQLLSARTRERHPRLHARAEDTLKQIDTTIRSVRQIINDLRPNVLDLGLNAAVDWQIEEFRRRTGIKCDLVEYHTDIAVDDNCATALFRILQESLTNVRRHALATWVRVDLQIEQGGVRMSVRDNGVGVTPGAHKPGTFGLIGIEERVRMLGGNFSICCAPGGGTIVEVTLPIKQENSGNVVNNHSPQKDEQLHDELV